MSARALLKLLNELKKSDKRRGLPSILSLFRNEYNLLKLFRNDFNKFNNTRAQMLEPFYQMP